VTSLDPELYALVHDGAPGDVNFYCRVTHGARTVLELGAGWGRVSLALAEAGPEVVGLENDEAMLALARRRLSEASPEVRERVRFVAGDMRAFALEERFDRIVVPFTGIYCLPDEDALAGCFRSVAAHLAEGGRFVFDAYAADDFHESSRPGDYPDDELAEVARVVHRGAPLTVYERSSWDRDRQRMRATYVYVGEDGAVVHEGSIDHRYLLSAQVGPLLDAAGLRLSSLEGSFGGTPFGVGGSLVVTAEKS
jgi:SAM-dependent methyltransferase